LQKISISGGSAFKICDIDNPFGISWASESLFIGSAKGVLRVSDKGGTPEVIIPVKENEIAHGPQLLPDGRSVLFTLVNTANDGTFSWDTAAIVAQAPGAREPKTLVRGGVDARFVGTGHVVYAVGGVLFAEPFDDRSIDVIGGRSSVVEGVARATQGGQTGSAQFAVSASGSLMYVPGPATAGQPGYDIALVDRKGAVERIKLPPRVYQSPRFSSDGKQLAFNTADGPASHIWVYDLAGLHAPRQLTFDGNNRFPIWTSDGQRIAFQSDREGDAGIFWLKADGKSGRADRLTKAAPGETQVPESWSPDGNTLLFSSRVQAGQYLLRTLAVPDKKISPFDDIRSNGELNSTFSPDGQWIAYAAR